MIERIKTTCYLTPEVRSKIAALCESDYRGLASAIEHLLNIALKIRTKRKETKK